MGARGHCGTLQVRIGAGCVNLQSNRLVRKSLLGAGALIHVLTRTQRNELREVTGGERVLAGGARLADGRIVG